MNSSWLLRTISPYRIKYWQSFELRVRTIWRLGVSTRSREISNCVGRTRNIGNIVPRIREWLLKPRLWKPKRYHPCKLVEIVTPLLTRRRERGGFWDDPASLRGPPRSTHKREKWIWIVARVSLRTRGQRSSKNSIDGRRSWIQDDGERKRGFDLSCTGVPRTLEQVENQLTPCLVNSFRTCRVIV